MATLQMMFSHMVPTVYLQMIMNNQSDGRPEEVENGQNPYLDLIGL